MTRDAKELGLITSGSLVEGLQMKLGPERSVEEVKAGKVKPDSIDEKSIARHLYAPDMPDPDLMVRTSGEFRISNYLLWEVAYSELVFTDVLWPDFRRQNLFDAITEFQGRSRRFGAIDADGNPTEG